MLAHRAMLPDGSVVPLDTGLRRVILGEVERMADQALRCLALAVKVGGEGGGRCHSRNSRGATATGMGKALTTCSSEPVVTLTKCTALIRHVFMHCLHCTPHSFDFPCICAEH
jgi:hypothetical protein